MPARELPDPARQFPTSLCHGCGARRYVEGRATLFIRCTARPEKYPPQPVLKCREFRPESPPRETPRR